MHSNGRCERLWLHPCGPEIFYFIFFKHAIHDCFSKIPFRTSFIFTFYHPEEVMCSPRIILAQLFFFSCELESKVKWEAVNGLQLHSHSLLRRKLYLEEQSAERREIAVIWLALFFVDLKMPGVLLWSENVYIFILLLRPHKVIVNASVTVSNNKCCHSWLNSSLDELFHHYYN